MAVQESIIIRVNEDSQQSEMTFDDWLDRGTSWWRTRATRVIDCDLAVIVDAFDRVVAAGRVRGVTKDLEGGSGRIAIDVVPLPEYALLGTKIKVNSSRNPISFVKSVDSADD